MNLFKKKSEKVICFVEAGGKKAEYADVESAGADLFAQEAVLVPAHSTAVVSTGFHVNLPNGYVGMVKGRSGMAFKHGIMGFNGVIDCGYDGAIGVLLFNTTDKAYPINKGDKIAQLVVMPYIKVSYSREHIWDKFLSSFKFNRGGGFGHSGK